jgi:hypothetical protein
VLVVPAVLAVLVAVVGVLAPARRIGASPVTEIPVLVVAVTVVLVR